MSKSKKLYSVNRSRNENIKKNNVLKKKDSSLQIQKLERKAAYENVIAFLQDQKVVNLLTKEIKLSYAA